MCIRRQGSEGRHDIGADAPAGVWDDLADVRTTVVYLAWAGAGTAPLERFAASLTAHPAGIEHTLVVAWKGYADPDTLAAARRIFAGVELEEQTVRPGGLDLTSYRQAAKSVPAGPVCFLNTHSAILADGWLGLLSRHLAGSEVGLVGAKGSHESPLSGPIRPLRLLRVGRYPAFPNPHVRTNGFMLDRDTMLSLRWPEVDRKGDAWELESGNDSVTRQIEAGGLAALVVGRDGVGYPRERWVQSETFRVGEQANLLVEDNRTRQYANAGPRLRRKLARLAWGDPSRAPAPAMTVGSP